MFVVYCLCDFSDMLMPINTAKKTPAWSTLIPVTVVCSMLLAAVLSVRHSIWALTIAGYSILPITQVFTAVRIVPLQKTLLAVPHGLLTINELFPAAAVATFESLIMKFTCAGKVYMKCLFNNINLTCFSSSQHQVRLGCGQSEVICLTLMSLLVNWGRTC